MCIGFVSATLTVKDIQSNSGHEYRMANDTIAINVSSTTNVSMDGKSCDKIDDTSYLCVSTDTVNSAKASYGIRNDAGETTTASINVDNNIGSVSYTIKNVDGNAMLDYSLQDLGFGNNNICSGIKSIDVYDGSSILNTVDIEGTSGTCTYSGSINLSIGNSGMKSVYLEVADNAGNRKQTPAQNLSLDFNKPEIVNGMILRYAGTDKEVSIIGASASFLADIYFSIREDNLDSITMDLSAVNSNPVVQYAYRNLDLPVSNCALNESSGVYDCVMRAISFRIPSGTVNIIVTAKDSFGAIGTATLTKSLTIDAIEPSLSMMTDRCDGASRCYVKSGLNKILITANKDNFENKYIFISVTGSSVGVNRVQNCSGTECYAIASLDCDSGTQIEAAVTSYAGFESQDDSGNPVMPYYTYFYCDNNAPVITSVNVTGTSNTVIKDLLVSGSTLTMTAKVIEQESLELNAYAKLDKIKNSTEKGTCVKTSSSGFDCTWNIAGINDGYYDAAIELNITDVIGNEALKTQQVKVFGFRSDNETPDAVKILLKDVYPKEINRIVLDMATGNGIPYYVYATYTLSPKSGRRDVSVLHQNLDISKCIYQGSLGDVAANTVFSDIRLNNPYSKMKDIGRVDLLFAQGTDPNLLDNKFTIACNISATVKEGEKIYKKTQDLPLEMEFEIVNTKLCEQGQECTPGEIIGKKIEKVEDHFLVNAKIMGTVNSIIPKLQKLCSIRSYVGQATSASQMLSMVMNGVAISTGKVDVGSIGIQLFKQFNGLDLCLSGSGSSGLPRDMRRINQQQQFMELGQERYTGKDFAAVLPGITESIAPVQSNPNRCTEFVGKACDFLMCTNTDEASKATTSVFDKYKGDYEVLKGVKDTGGTDALPDIFGGNFVGESTDILTKNINVPDVRNSVVMAAATGCWPAVYYNVNKWRQTDCNYLYCLKMAAYTGTDISTCDMTRRAQVCSVVVGEIFELPGANAIKNLMENAADYATNFLPLASASLLKKVACPEYTDGTADPFKSGKMDLPKTTAQQTFKVYGCQLPLQIARLADINTRSTQRGQFIYPETPDMCKYAECIGEENCQYEPDFWETINKIQLLPKNTTGNVANNGKIPTDKYKVVGESNQNLNDMARLTYLEKKKLAYKTKGSGTLSETEQKEYEQLVPKLQNAGYIDKNYMTEPDPVKLAQYTAAQQKLAQINSEINKLPVVTKPSGDTAEVTSSISEKNGQINTLNLVLANAQITNPSGTGTASAGQSSTTSQTTPSSSNPKQYPDVINVNDLGSVNQDATSMPSAQSQQIPEPLPNLPTESRTTYPQLTDEQIKAVTSKYGNPSTGSSSSPISTPTSSTKTPMTQEEYNQVVDARDCLIGQKEELLTQQKSLTAAGAEYNEYTQELSKLKAEKTSAAGTIQNLSKDVNITQTNIDTLKKDYKGYRDCLRKFNYGGATDQQLKECIQKTQSVDISQSPARLHDALTMPKSEYDKLSLDQKVEIDKTRIEAYSELEKLNAQLSPESFNSLSEDMVVDYDDPLQQNRNQLLARRAVLMQEMGLCGTGTETPPLPKCSEYNTQLTDILNDEGYAKLKETLTAKKAEIAGNIVSYEKTIKVYKQSEQFGNALLYTLQALNAKHMVDWMFTPYWTEKLFGVDLSDFLDFNKYKESLCNPANPINLGKESDSDVVISCAGGYCQPVLTYATERTELSYPNGTKYNIYTAVYYISGGDLRGRDVKYNVYFKGQGKQLYGFKDMQPVDAYSIIQKKKTFVSSKVYNEICIEFSENFPVDNSLNNAHEYCRKITKKAFDTGSPYTPEEEKNEGYLDEYDEDGNRIRASGSNTRDNRPPGVFEE